MTIDVFSPDGADFIGKHLKLATIVEIEPAPFKGGGYSKKWGNRMIKGYLKQNRDVLSRL